MERLQSQQRVRWATLQILGGEQHCQDLDEDKVCCVVPIARIFQTSQEYTQSLEEAAYHSGKQINVLKECCVVGKAVNLLFLILAHFN